MPANQSVRFSDFVDLLPSNGSMRPTSFPAGVRMESDENLEFVDPTLTSQKPISPGRTSAVIVSAPAAVGKTTIASEIARRTGALVWNLAEFRVGTGTFAGTVAYAFGADAAAALERFQSGDLLFVLDALDEAHVRAGGDSFDVFLDELIALLVQMRRSPSLVLLARSTTADWIALNFEDRGVPFGHYIIDYFGESQAKEFIDKRLDARGIDSHREQRRPFEEARDGLFGYAHELLDAPAEAPWSDEAVAQFLGYAPVLEALADYLASTQNYMTLVSELRSTHSDQDQWRFLVDVIEKILAREQDKICKALRPNIEPIGRRLGWSDWSSLYTIEEQCSRILAHHMRLQPEGPTRLPAEIEQVYEERIRSAIGEHALLREEYHFANIVFNEYVYAWGLTKAPERLANELRRRLRDANQPFLPSSLFARFALLLSRDREGGEARISAEDLGIVYESFLSRTTRPHDLWTEIFGEIDHADCVFSLRGDRPDEQIVGIVNLERPIHFWRQLANAEISGSCSVCLGLHGQSFALGPRVDLSCSALSVLAPYIEVRVNGDPVMLEAREYAHQEGELRVRVLGGRSAALRAYWPNMTYPWAQFRTERRRTAVEPRSAAHAELQKLLMIFRRRRTRKERTVRQARLAPEYAAERERVVAAALEHGVLSQEGRRGDFAFNSDFSCLFRLVDEGPPLTTAAIVFIEEILPPDEARTVVGIGRSPSA